MNRKPPLGPGTWLSWLAAGLFVLLSVLPRRLRQGLARVSAALMARRRSGSARIARLNLEACFPERDADERETLYREHLQLLSNSVLLTPRLWLASPATLKRLVHFEGLEHLQRAQGQSRAVVLLISHTAALDFGLIALSQDVPMIGFYKPFRNPVLDWLVLRSRTRFGGVPHARGEGFRAMLRSLREGLVLGYLSDEDLGPEGSVFAPFMGHQKATLAMLPRIVKATDAVVLPMNTFYDIESDRMQVLIEPPLDPYPGGSAEHSAALMNTSIESMVRRDPAQYLWQLKYFRTDPLGGPSRYRQIERGELGLSEL